MIDEKSIYSYAEKKYYSTKSLSLLFKSLLKFDAEYFSKFVSRIIDKPNLRQLHQQWSHRELHKTLTETWMSLVSLTGVFSIVKR